MAAQISHHTVDSARPGAHALLWAMAAGLPVIAEERASTRELIDDGATGLLFPRRDFSRAGACLLDLFDRPRDARRIGTAARAAVEARFACRSFAARLAAIYEQRARGERPRIDPEPAMIETRAADAVPGPDEGRPGMPIGA